MISFESEASPARQLLAVAVTATSTVSRLVGHSGTAVTAVTAVTEEVYRKQIRPVIQTGAVVMDGIFGAAPKQP